MPLGFIKRFFLNQLKSAYFSARESIGDHKRTLVVHQVEQTCTALQETRDKFQDALDRLKTIAHINDTALDYRYHSLNRQYQFCRIKSEDVSSKIRSIESVSEALFTEWEKELNEYTNKSLKSYSKQQLKLAKQRYSRLIKTMRNAEQKIQPVLAALKDQVLFLKHNLNAQAIAALQHEFIAIGIDISNLIHAVELTIDEANAYMAAIALNNQKVLNKL